jgi:hypothetical protein
MEELQNNIPAETTAVQESAPNMVPQEKVNELIGQAKQKARESGYQQATQEWQSKMGAAPQPSAPGGLDQNEISKLVAAQLNEHLQRQAQEQAEALIKQDIKRVSDELKAKMDVANAKNPDFKSITNSVNFSAFQNALLLSNTVESDIWPEVMVELARNPEKLDRIDSLAQKDPQAALVAMNKLKQSVKVNLDAQQSQLPKAPSNSLKSSNVGVGKRPGSSADFHDLFKGKY